MLALEDKSLLPKEQILYFGSGPFIEKWRCPGEQVPGHMGYFLHDPNQHTVYTPWAGPGGCQLCQVLGVEISGDLSWIVHVDRVATTANKTLGFIRRNIKTKSPTVQEMAYQSLVRLSWGILLQCGILILRNRPINRNDLKKSSP